MGGNNQPSFYQDDKDPMVKLIKDLEPLREFTKNCNLENAIRDALNTDAKKLVPAKKQRESYK